MSTPRQATPTTDRFTTGKTLGPDASADPGDGHPSSYLAGPSRRADGDFRELIGQLRRYRYADDLEIDL